MPAPTTVSADTHLLHHVFNPDTARESALKVTLTEFLPHVRDATADLRAATIEGVAAVQVLINAVNNDRLFSRSGPIAPLEERLDAASDKLRAALDSFKAHGTDAIVSAYGNKPRADMPLRSLYLGYVFGSTTEIIGEVVLSLIQTVAETSARRRRVRLWGPSSLRHAVKAVLKGRRKNEEQAFGEEEKDEEYTDEDDIEEKKYREYFYRLRIGTLLTGILGYADLDPDSHPPTNLFQRFMTLLHYFMQWMGTPEALVRHNPLISCRGTDTWPQVRIPICSHHYSALAPRRIQE
jgi:hypothetical protein